MKRSLLRAGVAMGMLVLLAVLIIGWLRHERNAEWAAERPVLSALVGASAPGLDARLAACAQRFASWPPDTAALAEFAQVCHANGQFEPALAAYRALMTLEPKDARWPHLYSAILAGEGRLDEALPTLRRACDLAPGQLIVWLRLGDALLKSNQTQEANTAYATALFRAPANPYALLGLARCDLQADRWTAARAHLQQAVASDPNFSDAQSLLATVFDRLGNPEAAAAARARVQRSGHYTGPADEWMDEIALASYDPYTLLTAASAALVEEKLDRALSLLERGLALAPDDARLHRQLGKTLAVRGDYPGARRELEHAVSLAPDNDAVRFDLIAILKRVQDEAAFERTVKEGLAATPNSAGLQFEAGRIAARAGQLDDAARLLDLSWRNGPDQSAAGMELATVYFRSGKTEAGIALLVDVLTRFPKENSALLMLVRHGIETADPRVREWLHQAAAGGIPAPLVAELQQAYKQRFGANAP